MIEQPEWTCPEIDKAIEMITSVVKSMQICCTENEYLQEQFSQWKRDLELVGIGEDCQLEKLRVANSKLREWGNHLLAEKEEMEEEKLLYFALCEDLKGKISDFEIENEKLSERISELEED